MAKRHGDDHPAAVRDWQIITNDVMPDNPRAYRTHHPGIEVTARIVWEDDGEEYMPGVATRWDAEHVYVALWRNSDKRLMTQGAWLRPADVRRR
jgi:hypothetical protein